MELERKDILNDMPMSGEPKSFYTTDESSRERSGWISTNSLVDDLYAALPELRPSDKFSKAKRSAKKTHRSK